MKIVKTERTGWRDEKLSLRHREWGWDCPAIDIDFLALEYDTGDPIALIEYKNEHAKPQYRSHPSYQALIKLGTRANLPVFAVRYADDLSWYRVVPLNSIARNHLNTTKTFDEHDFVSFLYKLRNRLVPFDIRKRLKKTAL